MIRIGIIGLDSTHATAFSRALNADPTPATRPTARVVAACPGRPTDFPLSVRRRAEIEHVLRAELGIPILVSPEAMAPEVDAFMILSCDGRRHLAEALAVLGTGKPVFIDKPLSSDWREAQAILQAAGARCFSASALRYRELPPVPLGSGPLEIDVTVPLLREPGHPDLLWYGIHGIEAAYALLGPGCLSVQRTIDGDGDVTRGVWPDGSTVRLHRRAGNEAALFPLRVRAGAVEQVASGHSYSPLLDRIGRFFATGHSPVAAAEMLETIVFAAAADFSRDRAGEAVTLADIFSTAAILPAPNSSGPTRHPAPASP